MNVMQLDSNHIWLIYLLPQYYNEEDVKPMWECDANGLSQIGVRIESRRGFKVQKCGLQLVYKKDIEDLNQQFDGGMESQKAKRTHDDCNEAGSSNDEPHPKRIERHEEIMAHCNSDREESSEYKECREELSESDLEG